jgi:large subunit ribosomal protein L17
MIGAHMRPDVVKRNRIMRHRVATKGLGRPTDQRLAILKSLVAAVLDHGYVTTTETRAKEVRSIIEKMITLGREDTLVNRRLARRWIPIGQKITTKAKYENVTGEALPYKLTPSKPGAAPKGLKAADTQPFGERLINKLFTKIGPRYKEYNGGYLRLTKLGGESHKDKKGRLTVRPARRGDCASMVKIELLEQVD